MSIKFDRMRKFDYQPGKLEADFFGNSKIDVFDNDDTLVLEVEKTDDSIWLISTPWLGVNVIEQNQADQLIQFLERRINNKLNDNSSVILHPNFFKVIVKN